ncbi:MAG: putative DNA-binding domain-containing protein [Rhodospirillales bacterium]|nr:putative DNA-binding domain-containing protein [Rhodospirillales bacterium]
MSSLLEQQRALCRALLAMPGTAEAAALRIDGLDQPGHARLAIYRNTVIATITDALRLGFPAVLRLVGEAYFNRMAAQFIAISPPDRADLHLYGEGFADFLQAALPDTRLEYLGDVARLEFAVVQALHAERVAALDIATLAAMPPAHQGDLRLARHPALHLLALGNAAHAVWSAVLAPEGEARERALAALRPSGRSERLAVVNRAGAIEILSLDAEEFAFAQALVEGRPLIQALDCIAEEKSAQTLAFFLLQGFFVARISA